MPRDLFDPGGTPNYYGTIVSISPEAALSLGSMEGMSDTAVAAPPAPTPRAIGEAIVQSPAFGYLMAGLVAALAYGALYLPFPPFQVVDGASVRHPLSVAMLAIMIGMVLRNTLPIPATVSLGCKKIVRFLIPIAIVLVGAGLSFTEIGRAGITAVTITIACVVFALGATYWVGKRLGLTHRTSMLLGIGTGICGSSAIVAAAPLVRADDEDMVLSIGAVNLFGLVMMLVLPALGLLLSMESTAFGIWAGTTIHAVPQVLAAGYDHSDEAGQLATLVKLGRVAMLAPIVFVLALATARTEALGSTGGKRRIHYARLVPWFVWGFLAMGLLNTLALLPTVTFDSGVSFELGRVLDKHIGQLLLTLAMAAIGLEVRLKSLLGVGGVAVLAGLISSILLAGASLLLIVTLV